MTYTASVSFLAETYQADDAFGNTPAACSVNNPDTVGTRVSRDRTGTARGLSITLVATARAGNVVRMCS